MEIVKANIKAEASDMYISSTDVKLVSLSSSKACKAKPGTPGAPGRPGAPAIVAVPEVKDEKGKVTQKAVKAVKAIPAIPAIPATADTPEKFSTATMFVYARNPKIGLELVNRLAIMKISVRGIDAGTTLMVAHEAGIKIPFQHINQAVIRKAVQDSKGKGTYNEAGYKVFDAQQKAKAQEVREKEKADAKKASDDAKADSKTGKKESVKGAPAPKKAPVKK